MDTLPQLAQNLGETLGWTVIHSLWQGGLLVAIAALVLHLLRQHTASLRYALAYGFLLLQVIVSVSTFGYYWPETLGEASVTAPMHIVLTELPATDDILASVSLGDWVSSSLAPYTDLIAGIWLLGMVFFLLRLLLGMIGLQQLRRSGQALPPEWNDLLQRLVQRMRLRQSVRLLASSRVDSPMLLGQFRPLILLPIGMINQLTTEQVEAVLAHELAHLRRYDYWLNLLQHLIETLFYYHPALWWLNDQIRAEREHCCDDLAVRVCGDDLLYARTLYTLENLRRSPPLLALAFSGHKQQSLLTRINRIITSNYKQPNTMEKLTITGLLLGLAFLFTVAASWPADTPTTLTEHNIIAIDSLPDGKTRIRTDYKGKKVDVRVENRAIRSLSIDGKEIAASDFAKHQPMVEQLFADMPPPPPAPPTPPRPGAIPAPPPPPAPPTPPNGMGEEAHHITIEDTDDGQRRVAIIHKGDDGSEKVIINRVIADGEWAKAMGDGTNVEIIHLSDSIKLAFQNVQLAMDSLPQTMRMAFAEFDNIDLKGVMDSIKITLADIDFDKEIKLAMDSVRIVFEDEEWQEEMRQGLAEAKEALEDIDIEMHESEDGHTTIMKVTVPGEESETVFVQRNGPKGFDLIETLTREGLVKEKGKYKIELSTQSLTINGDVQAASTHQRILDEYQAKNGKAMSANDKIKININRD